MGKRKTSRTGRPRGSANRNYLDAIEIPAACPRCRSANLLVVKGSKTIERNITGAVNSVAYDRVRWTRRQCQECGQFVAVRTYSNESNNGVSSVGE